MTFYWVVFLFATPFWWYSTSIIRLSIPETRVEDLAQRRVRPSIFGIILLSELKILARLPCAHHRRHRLGDLRGHRIWILRAPTSGF